MTDRIADSTTRSTVFGTAANHLTKSPTRSSNSLPVGSKVSGVTDEVGFHLLGDKFKGAEFYPNLVPANANLNRSAFRSIEKLREAAAVKGYSVDVTMDLVNGPASNIRPTAFRVGFSVNGKDFKILLQNQAGEVGPRSFKTSVRSAF